MKYLVAFNIKKLMREKEQLFHLQSLCNKIIVKCLFLETKKMNYNFFCINSITVLCRVN